MQNACSKFLVQLFFVFIFVIGSGNGQATEGADPVKIAVGFSIEPYMLKSGKGIIGSVITESFLQNGMRVEFVYYSNQEAIDLFNEGKVDGVSVVKQGMVHGKYSEPLVTFKNHVISLARSGIHIEKLSELKNYRIVAFSNARRYLGPDFSNVVEHLESYREIASQEQQVKALFDGETDIIISDKTIFEFYRTRLRNRTPQEKKWLYEISIGFGFPESVYHVAFQTELFQQAFNHGFENLKASGRHQQIVDTYLDLMGQY